MRTELVFQFLALQPSRIILTHQGYSKKCQDVKRQYKWLVREEFSSGDWQTKW